MTAVTRHALACLDHRGIVSDPLDRRDFLERLALLAGAAVLPLPLPGCRETASAPHARKVLDVHEWAVIDAQLAEPHFGVFRREVTRGIRVLDRFARARRRARFDALSPDDQDAVLAAIARGEGGKAGFDSGHFFQVLFTLTLEGFLSDPVHGGNAGGVGWNVIGYAPSAPRPHRAHRGRHG